MRIATDLTCTADGVPYTPLIDALVRGADPPPVAGTAWDQRFHGLAAECAVQFTLVDLARSPGDLSSADVVVVPVDWYWVRGPSWATRPNRQLARRCRELSERATLAGKPVVVFFSGDRSCDHVDLPGAIIVREGAYRSRQGALDRAMPAFAEDLVTNFLGGRIVERTKAHRPVVGFCGLAGRSGGWRVALRLAAYHAVVLARERHIDPSPRTGEQLRADALAALDADARIDTNFVVRSSSTFFRDGASTDLTDVRREYVDNLRSSDYVLCIRGSGNYSYRLCETLSMGRIPVLVDTDCALPPIGDHDWRAHTMWVDHREVADVAEIVAQFHSGITANDFVDLQHANRRLWLDRLRPEGFYPNLATLIGIPR